MHYDEFIHKVREYSGLDSFDEAVKITTATLETLGERLSRDEKDDISSQLPKELKDCLFRREEITRFIIDEFYNRVSARADVGLPHAIEQAKAVIRVLREAISPGELEHILHELPKEYDELFGKRG